MTKAEIISNLESYTNKAIEALTAFDCNVYLAKTMEEAQKLIRQSPELIISQYIHLNKALT